MIDREPRQSQNPEEKPSFAKAVRWLRHGTPGQEIYDDVLEQAIPLDSPFPQGGLADKLAPQERLWGAIFNRYPSEEVLLGRTQAYYDRKEEKDTVRSAEGYLSTYSAQQDILSSFTGVTLEVVEYLIGGGAGQTNEEIASDLGLTVEEIRGARQEASRILGEKK